jgi:hypothetical protein
MDNLEEFKKLSADVERAKQAIKDKTNEIIQTGDVKLMKELGEKLVKLSSNVMSLYMPGSDLLEAAKKIEETPNEDEKTKIVSMAEELLKKLNEIYKAEGWVSFEGSIDIRARSVRVNAQFGEEEHEDDRGTWSGPEYECDIIIKKNSFVIEEFVNTPDGIDNRGSEELKEVSVQAVLDYLEDLNLPKKESYKALPALPKEAE